jgi:hypothetical protein
MFILCLCCPVFKYKPCDELITRPRSPTVCKMIMKLKNQRTGPKGTVEPVKENNVTTWLLFEINITYLSHCDFDLFNDDL